MTHSVLIGPKRQISDIFAFAKLIGLPCVIPQQERNSLLSPLNAEANTHGDCVYPCAMRRCLNPRVLVAHPT